MEGLGPEHKANPLSDREASGADGSCSGHPSPRTYAVRV